MELILWRHAEAEDGFPDTGRALTEKGHKQADKMAGWLKSRLDRDARILVSPTLRTQQTATALTQDFSTVDALAPGADAQAILDAAGWPRAGGTVLIVGHQPTLGGVVSLLLNGSDTGVSIKKSAVWWLSSRKRGNGAETILKAVITPDLV